MTLIGHDPGHGRILDPKHGPDPGTVHGALTERDWVLQLALDLAAATPWAAHMLLRKGESGLAYSHRAEEADRAGCDLVICHHVNSHRDPDLDGLMAFHLQGDHLGREVGDAVMRAAPFDLLRHKAKSTPARPDDWTQDAHAVMDHYRDRGLPVVLIEWGFASAPRDYAVLQSPASRPALCAAGAVGIARAMELTHPG